MAQIRKTGTIGGANQSLTVGPAEIGILSVSWRDNNPPAGFDMELTLQWAPPESRTDFQDLYTFTDNQDSVYHAEVIEDQSWFRLICKTGAYTDGAVRVRFGQDT